MEKEESKELSLMEQIEQGLKETKKHQDGEIIEHPGFEDFLEELKQSNELDSEGLFKKGIKWWSK